MEWFRRREKLEDRALTSANVPAVMLSPTASGVSVTATNALGIADAFACVRALADAAASLPLVAYRRTAGGRERLEGGVAELLRRPAPATTQANLVGQLMAHLNLHGNAFVGKYRDGDGRVESLALIAPERVQVELRGGLPLYEVTDARGSSRTYSERDVLHVRGLSVDGLLGLSPVAQAREALGLSARLTEHAARFFQNDARPSGVLTVPAGPTAQDQVDNLARAWQKRHGGTEGAHRIAVLTGDVSFQSVSMPLEDAQFLGQRQLSTAEIARVFRIPPWVVGASAGDSLTYSNTTDQIRAFVVFSLAPWLTVIEQALTADPDLCAPGQYVEFLLDGLLRGSPSERSEIYTRALDPLTGWMTREEVRRMENLGPEPTPAPRPAVPIGAIDA